MKNELKKTLALAKAVCGLSFLLLLSFTAKATVYAEMTEIYSYTNTVGNTSVPDPYSSMEVYCDVYISCFSDSTATTPVAIPPYIWFRWEMNNWEYLYEDFNYTNTGPISEEMPSVYTDGGSASSSLYVGTYMTFGAYYTDYANGNYVSYDHFPGMLDNSGFDYVAIPGAHLL